MRLISSLFLLVFSFNVFSNSQTAEELYNSRGENTQNAFKAYEIYLKMSESESNKDVKADDFWHASQAVYYVGSKAVDNAEKKKFHQLGFEVAAKAVALLEGQIATLNPAQKETLANSYYFYGANLGKWGEANGIASSLGRWPELQETMKKVIALKMAHVQDYGAYRILGRAFYKLPFPLGSNKKALKYLETAFDETKNGHDISHHGLNIIYYVNVLIAEDNKALAKTILTSFVSKDPMTFNVERIPETKDELIEAKEILKGL